jgi:hypothetical protein
MKKIYTSIIASMILAIGLLFSFGAEKVTAGVSLFYVPQGAKTAAATTTRAYLTPGTGTTTVTVNSDLVGKGLSLDSITMLTQVTATTTQAPVVYIRVDDSQDGVDWYSRSGFIHTTATTSTMIGNYSVAQINVSTSTTPGGSATTTRTNASLEFKVRTKYTRFTYFVPVAGGNVSLWAMPVAKAENF